MARMTHASLAGRRDVVADIVADAVRSGRATSLRLTGDSMRPLFEPGTRVTVAAIAPAAVRPGDVLVFRVGDRLVCHRVLLTGGGRFLTSGDAHPARVTWVDAVDVLARVTGVGEERGRRFDTFAARARGVALAVRGLAAVARVRGRARWRRHLGAVVARA